MQESDCTSSAASLNMLRLQSLCTGNADTSLTISNIKAQQLKVPFFCLTVPATIAQCAVP